ncbi:MAG: M56 family metallopeptidase [Solirubrobacteraceae bacterium]
MTAAFAGFLLAAIAVPHWLPLDRVTPLLAAGVWLAALLLRAITTLLMIMLVTAFVPATGLFAGLTHWCWHLVPPLFASHVGVSGHSVGHAATLAPAAILAGSFASAAWAVSRAARAVKTLLADRALGRGPEGTVIIGGREVVIAAAGLRRPRIVVSAGALTDLDDAELAASIEHERGHLAHRHRYVLLVGEACRAVSCLLPGGRRAFSELAFHLERDADEYALTRRHDRLALASAICKALPLPRAANGLMALGGGPSVVQRVGTLLDGATSRGRAATRMAALCTVLMATLTLGLGASLPAYATASATQLATTTTALNCPV